MQCLCYKSTSHLKVEADFGADPIWCHQCSYNLDISSIPLSNSLKQELNDWVLDFGKWYDWKHEQVIKSKSHWVDKHNQLGEILTEKVKQELSPSFTVTFVPYKH
ncbi:hypothetical protein GI584_22120 [Gracilibacillus salitolerans]|uniref:Uncharacterized protein n=1 Tax=Gracilibacillus salitolerans TaxID=2663022 RepID=A0A5Q2TR71_9BACI|nr:hypothetical protein [Gracilibacillus salitolerans]QGH36582.1 hypothetical protein GI584_22120 [Gracilibacillus salitolerans]